MKQQGQALERDRIRAGQRVPTTGERVIPAPAESGERFAAYVAHELRNTLSTQRALLELAFADPNADVASWRKIGEDVLRACLEQERLVEACLVLARTQDGKQRCETVDLAVITAAALQAHDLSGLERVVVLESAWATGDPGLLERLVANLVSNAIRHNIVGGQIEIATRTESGRAHLAVANTGSLLPGVELRRLFQPFQRLNANRSDGVGLGLTIVQAVADLHDATVTAQARIGGGLGIELAFPAPTEMESDINALPPSTHFHLRRGGRRVLAARGRLW